MHIAPTRFDLWFITWIARILGKNSLFDLGIQSAINNNVLGGFCFGCLICLMDALCPEGKRATTDPVVDDHRWFWRGCHPECSISACFSMATSEPQSRAGAFLP